MLFISKNYDKNKLFSIKSYWTVLEPLMFYLDLVENFIWEYIVLLYILLALYLFSNRMGIFENMVRFGYTL